MHFVELSVYRRLLASLFRAGLIAFNLLTHITSPKL